MIPHVERGDRMAGLMNYLTGPGRHNEHTEPHLVAGSAGLMTWFNDDELDGDAAMKIARHLDLPRVVHGTKVSGGHVWHTSLSIKAAEGELTDERWGQIARDFVAKMYLDDNDGTKAGTRWVAVRHGKSTSGNDHIHIALNLVREDGTKADVGLDWSRAQKAARELEKQYGLEQIDTSHSSKAYKRGEREAAARRAARAKYAAVERAGGPAWKDLPAAERRVLERAQWSRVNPRDGLARTVRACAAASRDEAQFVRQLRHAGLLVFPRLAAGRDDVVTGYSVAVRPPRGERPIKYSGTSLGQDLGLPRLREAWPDTPQGATDAAAEWTAAMRKRRPADVRPDKVATDDKAWEQQAAALAALREQLRGIPVDDRDTWARVAGQTAGAFAAWSQRTERTPGPLAATSDALAKSARVRRSETPPKPAPIGSPAGAALLLMQAVNGGQGAAAQAIMLRELANLAKALHDMHRAAGNTQRASQIATAVRSELVKVSAGMASVDTAPVTAPAVPAPVPARPAVDAPQHESEAVETAARLREQYGTARLDAPVPNGVTEPARDPAPASGKRPRVDRGIER